MSNPPRQTVAVIGSGVAGLTAAHLLQRQFDVHLFEADDRLGGHAHTHDVALTNGQVAGLDSAFLVHNDRTYPNLLRLFAELGVATQESEMSMSVRCDGCGLEYAGSKGLGGLFAQRSNVVRPRYLAMLAQVKYFHRQARAVLTSSDSDGREQTLQEFLEAGHFTEYFTNHFMLPLVSAVWSCGFDGARGYPARYLFRFLDNHGMLSVTGSPQWRTVVGGSRNYVERAAKNLSAVNTSTPIRSITRHADGVRIRDEADQLHDADRVVIATHPDQALRLLADPSTDEKRLLSAFEYLPSTTLLHTDASVLPRNPAARASWNYRMDSCRSDDKRVKISYDLKILQRITDDADYVVTLNADGAVDPSRVLAEMNYAHPTYTRASVAAQRELSSINDGRTAFAGAWQGWGFHEDGCASGVRAAESFGGRLVTALDRSPAEQRSDRHDPQSGPAPRIYFATTTHRRNSNAPGAVTRSFRYSTCYWLVDVDDLPTLPRPLRPFTRFEARDHLGDPAAGIAANVRAMLAENDLRADRILLLTCPRVVGHVFNPLSVFYCFSAETELIAVVAEVHNTYGGRHVYLLRPDDAGRDTVGKEFYVSPFLPMGGDYLMRTPVPDERLAVSIALRQGGQTPFVATLTGRGRTITTASVVVALVRWPLLTMRTAALIRWQGIRLWLRKVPVQPRPADATQHEHGR